MSNLMHHLSSFSFLVPWNTTLTKMEFVETIEKTYCTSNPQIEEAVCTIKDSRMKSISNQVGKISIILESKISNCSTIS